MSNTIKKIEEKILKILEKEEFVGGNGAMVRDLSSAILNLTHAEKVRDDMKSDEDSEE